MIEPARWGRDHYSTFAYLGHVVHNPELQGHPDRRKMRCKPGNHKQDGLMALVFRDAKYPTRLQGGVVLDDHDDWDCAADIVGAGLLVDVGSGMFPCFKLTERGLAVWSYIARTRPTAGSMDSLTWDEVCREAGIAAVCRDG